MTLKQKRVFTHKFTGKTCTVINDRGTQFKSKYGKPIRVSVLPHSPHVVIEFANDTNICMSKVEYERAMEKKEYNKPLKARA